MPRDRGKNIARQQRRQMERMGASGPEPPSSSTLIARHSTFWAGPLPHPSVLKEYSFIKDGPERLFRSYERQAVHRQKIENRDSWTEAFQRIYGPISATIVGLGGIAAGTYLITSGHSITGLSALIGTLAMLAAAVQGAKRSMGGSEDEAPAEQREMFDPSRT